MSGTESTPLDPRVTAIVPAYGRPEFLREAVESVADQTYPNLELVVVDDHSPDPVEPAVEAAATEGLDRRVLRHDENRGANAARRTGIDAAEGSILCFLDDDDYWRPSYVERVVEAFERGGPAVGVVTVGVEVVDADGERVGGATPRFAGDVTEAILVGEVQPGTYSRTAVRRAVVDEAGYPDERFPSWQDQEWHIRLSRHCEYASVPEELAVRRYSDREQITDDFAAKRDVSYPLLIRKHGDLAASYGPSVRRRFVGRLTRTLGFSALRNGHYLAALRYLLEAVGRNPRDRHTYAVLLAAVGGPLTYRPARRLRRWLAG
ncbi:glycosyltransferase family 2 protein [Halobaculum sp. EA56]|uniref:glycosyltransferase family 2 protein n=1 Tax=Halobaculum sp. EA56 TaxID=3421648 RepID=UPI003EC0DC48